MHFYIDLFKINHRKKLEQLARSIRSVYKKQWEEAYTVDSRLEAIDKGVYSVI